ncbi:saccharopine dehydrogenase NADP-binding domain-containing protein [Nocardia sp. NPDC023988]|uniref:saccharopine dehydrogenase family protein n=1 Tax=unclassified Nocardia TaxID=2637762 RepID=UPI0033CB3964
MSHLDGAPTVLIYGAYGYTGELVVAEALSRGLRPLISGRSAERVGEVAARHGLTARPFDLADPDNAAAQLADVDIVLHCAGPFVHTYAPMLEACLASGTNYLDVTGETQVFAAIYARHDDAVRAGITVIPGVGFDIVPTDHLVARLVGDVPDAVGADVAMISRGGFSRGTLRTAVDGIARGNLVRSGGDLVAVPHAHRALTIDVGRGRPVGVASTPLGDVCSAGHGYGLTEVATFTAVPLSPVVRALSTPLRFVTASGVGRTVTDLVIDRIPVPDQATRDATRSTGWARVYRADGSGLSLAVDVSNTYAFTARSMVHAAITLHSRPAPPGAHTPANALGADFLLSIPGGDISWPFPEPRPA